MIVLKIIGWILFGTLVLLVLALCIKVRLIVEYSEVNTHAELKWLFLKIPLYPSKKKEKKVEEKPAEEEKKTEKPEPEKKESLLRLLYNTEGVDGILLIVKQTFGYLNTFLGNLMRAFVVDELYTDICCAKSDAASTAIYYGEVCSLLFPMLGSLAKKCKLKNYDINVYPDFLARYGSASFFISVHVFPIYIAGISLALIFKLLFNVILKLMIKISKQKNKRKGSKTADTKASAVLNR